MVEEGRGILIHRQRANVLITNMKLLIFYKQLTVPRHVIMNIGLKYKYVSDMIWIVDKSQNRV
jgi:hypothetical protein